MLAVALSQLQDFLPAVEVVASLYKGFRVLGLRVWG